MSDSITENLPGVSIKCAKEFVSHDAAVYHAALKFTDETVVVSMCHLVTLLLMLHRHRKHVCETDWDTRFVILDVSPQNH